MAWLPVLQEQKPAIVARRSNSALELHQSVFVCCLYPACRVLPMPDTDCSAQTHHRGSELSSRAAGAPTQPGEQYSQGLKDNVRGAILVRCLQKKIPEIV